MACVVKHLNFKDIQNFARLGMNQIAYCIIVADGFPCPKRKHSLPPLFMLNNVLLLKQRPIPVETSGNIRGVRSL